MTTIVHLNCVLQVFCWVILYNKIKKIAKLELSSIQHITYNYFAFVYMLAINVPSNHNLDEFLLY